MEIIDEFISLMKKKEIVINYLQIHEGSSLIGEYSRLDTKTRLNVYSVSKSITSIGVGIANDEGVFHLDDRLAQFFPEYNFEKLSPYLSEVRVKDFLTMTCGLGQKLFFSDDKERYATKDWIDYFMHSEFLYEPGVHFSYSNFNAYMLSCIVERQTGETLLDYMKPRFFEKIGIGNPDWMLCPMGHNTGAYGLMLTIDEMSRIGLFLLQNGVWNGERILSENYIREATVNHIHTNTPQSGYGYQFWINPDGTSYRADGKYGQYIVVVPENNLVVTVQALDTKNVFDDLWEKLVNPLKERCF